MIDLLKKNTIKIGQSKGHFKHNINTTKVSWKIVCCNKINLMETCQILTFIVLLFVITACSPIKVPEKNKYDLTSINPDTIHAKYQRKVLLITTPTAVPAYKTDKMAYMKKPYHIQYYAENKWVGQPAKLLTPLIVSSLEQTNHFRSIVATPYTGDADYRIDTTLLKLEQNFMDNPSEVELSARFSVIDNQKQRLIASKTIDTIATAPGNDPYSGVIAANRAVADMLGKMSQFVVRVI